MLTRRPRALVQPAASLEDQRAAFSLYKDAAQGWDTALAHCHLGVCYEQGVGTAKSMELAVKHYSAAAAQSHAR
jgi:TPR repeat protein